MCLKIKPSLFASSSGWEQPNWFALPGDEAGYKPSFSRTNWFEPVGRECDLVLTRAGVIDLTPFGKIEVKGRDANRFMDCISANSLPKVNKFDTFSIGCAYHFLLA